MKIKITADSTCDLPAALVEKYNIDILPLYIVEGDHAYRDGIDITPPQLFEKAASGSVFSTAAVNVADYIERFTPLLEKYDAIVHINIGSEFSACHQNALLAAQELDRVYLVDSRNLTTGSGLLVLHAAELAADENAKPEEIVAALEARRDLLDSSFVLETLDYLRRGGRCSAVAAFGANLLNLKPCIEVRDGKMGLGKKYRGSMDKLLPTYVADRLSDRTDIDYGRIFITHSGVSEQVLEKVREAICRYGDFGEIIVGTAGCTISNHCGPGVLGILYCHK